MGLEYVTGDGFLQIANAVFAKERGRFIAGIAAEEEVEKTDKVGSWFFLIRRSLRWAFFSFSDAVNLKSLRKCVYLLRLYQSTR